MSLWNKSVWDITFQDVEAFCRQKQKEGPRLDYKRDFNQEHHKLICAFANTLGGTIILGIDGDDKNEPMWPPSGLTTPEGIEDRIIQVAQDAIYPSVRPSISRLLIDPTSGKAVLVVRVDESPEAPHAVNKGREAYVYERAGSTNKPWALASIDRIEYLLNRRRSYEQQRESYIQKAIARGRRYLDAPAPSVRWASIIPLYPWRKLCDPELCYSLHCARYRDKTQRFPEGTFAVHGASGPNAIESMTAHGHMFVMEYPIESHHNVIATQHGVEPNNFLMWRRTVKLVNETMFNLAKQFFGHESVEMPGLLQFDVGFLNAFGKQMFGEADRIGQPFPDLEFRTHVVFPVEELIRDNTANCEKLFDAIRHGFDLHDGTPRGTA